MEDDKPRVDDVPDDVAFPISLQLLVPGYLLKRILKAPYKESTGERIEEDTVADAIRWLARDQFADSGSEPVQKSKPGYVEGIDRPRYAHYGDPVAYERAKTRWRATMRALGYDPNDMPLFAVDDDDD